MNQYDIKGDLLWRIGSCEYGAEKSHSLAFARQRPSGELGGVAELKGLRTMGTRRMCPSPQAGEPEARWPAQESGGVAESPLFSAFWFCRALNRLDAVHPPWGRESTYWAHQFKCWSHQETPSQTYPEIMFNHISGHPSMKTNWHKTVTLPYHSVELCPDIANLCSGEKVFVRL